MLIPNYLIYPFGIVNRKLLKEGLAALFGLIVLSASPLWAEEPGITDKTIRIGSTLVLKGDAQAIGQGVKQGIEAAFAGEHVQGRTLEFVALNDFYDPATTPKAVQQLVDQGIFLMLGSTGTPTARAALPILAEHHIPAVGFITGAGFKEPGDILNFRASYVQEVTKAIEAALEAGIKPNELCAYVQNDAYGMTGIQGLRQVLAKQSSMDKVVAILDQILAMQGPAPARNNLGPVGVYQRDTLSAREGYKSLKDWEAASSSRCRFVVTIGLPVTVAQFIGYTRYKGEGWIFSVASPGGGAGLKAELDKVKVTDGVVITQIVPALDSALPIVEAARKPLGKDLNDASLEGYIIGRMVLEIMRNISGPLTRENFLKAARSRVYDLGGLKIDFSNGNQGSDFVLLTYLNGGNYQAIAPEQLKQVLKK